MADDWIDSYVKHTENMEVPELFRLWSGISAISGVLERRVWTVSRKGRLYPNMFVVLVGEPASGKTLMVNEVRKLWVNIDAKNFHVGPDNPTKASFLDSLEKASRTIINGSSTFPLHFHFLNLACREFGVLVQPNDVQFMEDLTDLFDCPIKYWAPRRTSVSVDIDRPGVNILAAATPGKLAEVLPELSWHQGFASRLFLIHGAPISDFGDQFEEREEMAVNVLAGPLKDFHRNLLGQFHWSSAAKAASNAWKLDLFKPVPEYSRLRHYNSRRNSHSMKLAMISAVSAGHGLEVQLSDFERARAWMIEAEGAMPNVFRSMYQRSDTQLIDDLAHFVRTRYFNQPREGRKPVHDFEVYGFLEVRVQSERMKVLIEVAEKTGRIVRGPFPNEWIPGADSKSAGNA